MKTAAEIEGRVLAIVAETAGRALESLGLETPLFGGGLDLDSVSVVRIVTRVEQELGAGLDDDDLDLAALESIGSLARFVTSQLAFGGEPRDAGGEPTG